MQRHTESVRDERGTRWLDNLAQDIRFAIRQYARTPWSTATIVLLLSLGIAANAWMFTLVDYLQFSPGPSIARDASLVRIRGITYARGGEFIRLLSVAELGDYRARRDVFAGVAGLSQRGEAVVRMANVEPSNEGIQYTTSGYLGLLGVKPELGTVLPAEDDAVNAGTPSAFLSYAYWRSRLGGADIVGQQLQIGDGSVTIVGVAPPGFDAAASSSTPRVSVWLSLSASRVIAPHNPLSRDDATFYAVARLAKGVSIDRAEALASTIGTQAAARWTTERVTTTSDVVRLRKNNRDAVSVRGNSELLIIAMFAAVTLLIAAVIGTNISALFLARAVARQREIGVRLSLGATRARLIRQLLTESTLLGAAAGAVGLGLFAAAIRVVNTMMREDRVYLSAWPLAATLLFALIVGVLFGLSPALHATRASVFEAMKGSSASGTRATRGQRRLVIAQIALSQPLLVGVGLLVTSIVEADRARARGDFDARIVEIEVSTPNPRNADDTRGISIAEQGIVLLSGIAGVERASAATGWTSGGDFEVQADDAAGIAPTVFRARTHPVAAGYFDAMGARVTRGREFDRTDVLGTPGTAVIGSDLAMRLYGTANPVGRTLRCAGRCGSESELVIIGVVDAEGSAAITRDGGDHVFVALSQKKYFQDPRFVVRVSTDGAAMINPLRTRLRETFPDLPIQRATTRAAEDLRHRRENALTAGAATAGGLLALVLAAIGLYAIVSFAVQQRLREIGVRIALGAGPSQVVRHFFRDGFIVSIAGCAIGLPASVFAIRGIQSAMPIETPGMIGVATLIALAVSSVAMIATWIPARRAASVDPIRTLRQE
ncbi:MAG TPA: FtsX-like permease family protein [Gemmatimonadaceae bacterium]|nr:FtsX-like permease family protein [Gemmatimonadaceae bacterium]